MGITSVPVRIGNPADRSRAIDAEMIVDSGAIYYAAVRGQEPTSCGTTS